MSNKMKGAVHSLTDDFVVLLSGEAEFMLQISKQEKSVILYSNGDYLVY